MEQAVLASFQCHNLVVQSCKVAGKPRLLALENRLNVCQYRVFMPAQADLLRAQGSTT